MRKAFRASRLMSLLVVALGVMAFGATVAHAEPGAFWKVNGAKLENHELKPQIQVQELETLAATGVKEGILLTKVGFSFVEILCTEMKFVDALLALLGQVLGKIHFQGCITKLNKGAAAGACKPHSPGAAEGLIETELLLGLLKLHTLSNGTKDDRLLLEPDPPAKNFVVLKLGKEVGSECSIGTEFKITGDISLKAATDAEALNDTVTKLIQEAAGELPNLFFGENPATIDGSAIVKLIGAHEGMTWAGWPN